MIVYYNTKEQFEVNDIITIKAFKKIPTQQENAKDEVKLDFQDPEFSTYALAVRCKVFDPLCNDHLHQLMKEKNNIRLSKLQDTLNNTAQIVNKNSGIHQALIKLGFRAAVFYEDNQAHLFTLDAIDMQVLRIDTFGWYQTTKKTPLNLN